MRRVDTHLRLLFRMKKEREKEEKETRKKSADFSQVKRSFSNVFNWLPDFAKRVLACCLPIAALCMIAYAISPKLMADLWHKQGLNWLIPSIAFALALAQYIPIRGLRTTTVVLCLVGLAVVASVAAGKHYGWFSRSTKPKAVIGRVVPEPKHYLVHLPAKRWVDTGIVPRRSTLIEVEPPTSASISIGSRDYQALTSDGFVLRLRSRLGTGKPIDDIVFSPEETYCGRPATRASFDYWGNPYREHFLLWADKSCSVTVYVYE